MLVDRLRSALVLENTTAIGLVQLHSIAIRDDLRDRQDRCLGTEGRPGPLREVRVRTGPTLGGVMRARHSGTTLRIELVANVSCFAPLNAQI